MDNNLTKLGDKIYNLRKQKNITQEELGEMVGVSRQTVSQWEANIISPKADNLQKIIEVLDVDASYFFVSANKGEILIHEKTEEDLVVSDIVEIANDRVDNVEYEQQQTLQSPKERKALSKKVKAYIIVSVITMSILIIALVFSYILTPKNEGFGVVIDRTFNFDALSICWIVFILAAVAITVVGICMLFKAIKRKK